MELARFIRFCVVGASGYAVNLATYTLLVRVGDIHYVSAATAAFLVAGSSNYLWNRRWTFRSESRAIAREASRSLAVSVWVWVLNLLLLVGFVTLGAEKTVAQAAAIGLLAPLSYGLNRAWCFSAAPRFQ